MFALKAPQKLPPTRKLFHADPYLAEATATVLHAQDDLLVLDQTIFYAESGGQVADRGQIDGLAVIDVQKNPGMPIYIARHENPYNIEVPPVQIDTVVVHRLAQPAPFVAGQPVRLSIDWAYRYQNMRHHSAAHFLYLAVRDVYGRRGHVPETKGCYICETSARFDYQGKLDPAALPDVAALANEWIGRGQPIAMEPDPRTDDVFYWVCGDLVVPCGGTHVRSAGELAPIRLKRQSQGKSVDRVYGFLLETSPSDAAIP